MVSVLHSMTIINTLISKELERYTVNRQSFVLSSCYWCHKESYMCVCSNVSSSTEASLLLCHIPKPSLPYLSTNWRTAAGIVWISKNLLPPKFQNIVNLSLNNKKKVGLISITSRMEIHWSQFIMDIHSAAAKVTVKKVLSGSNSVIKLRILYICI